MLNKTKINLSKKITAIFFTVFLLVGFLNFGSLPVAEAACNFQITRFDTEGVQQVGMKDTLNFHGIIKRSESFVSANDNAQCKNSFFTVTIITEDISLPVSGKFISVTTSASPSLFNSQGLYEFTKTINLGNYSSTQFENKTTLKFSLTVSGSESGASAKTSYSVNFNYSGNITNPNPSGSSSIKPLTLTLDTGGSSVLGKGDSFEIRVQMSPADVRGLASRITTLVMETYVNGKKVGGYEINRSWLETNSPTQYVESIQTPVFQDKSNNIEVKIIDLVSGSIVGKGSAVLQVQGLGTAPTVNNSTKLPNSSACTISSACQSNFCDDTVGTCAACSGPADCTSGSTCNAGVCLSAAAPGAGTNPPAAGTDVLYNPLPIDSLTGALLLVAKGFLGVIAIWASVFIIIGGFQMVMSAGNEEAVLKAKKTITWAVLGLVVAVMSFSIIAIVQNLFKATVKEVPLGQEINITKNIL